MDSVRNVNRSAIRPFAARHPRLVVFTLTAATLGVVFRYRADALQKNELRQRASTGYYVSVDRSGGGI